MKLRSSLICSVLFLTSCLSTPGIEEPEVIECAILNDSASCGEVDVPLSSLVGFIAVSPDDYAKIKNHHEALHHDLNACKAKKR